MTPGARRRRSATRRKLGRTRAARTAARDARKPPRAYIRGRDVRMVMRIGGEEVTLENAGARVVDASSFYGIDRSVAPERLSGSALAWSAEFTAHDTGSGPLHFTTDHSSWWDSLWSAIGAAGAIPVHPHNLDALREEMAAYPRDRHDDQVDALAHGLQMAGVQTIPSRHAMTQTIERLLAPFVGQTLTQSTRAEIVRRIRDEFYNDPAMRDHLLRSISEPVTVHVQNIEAADPDRWIMDIGSQLRVRRPPSTPFARCQRLRRVLNDELTTPDGFPFTAPQ